MKRSKATPARLAGFSLLGSLIAASAFLGAAAASHYRNFCNGVFFGSSFISYFIPMMAIVCGGGYLTIWVQRELKDGIQSYRWTDAELSSVRNLFESWPVKIASAALLSALLIVLAIALVHPHFGPVFVACFLLSHGSSSLKSSLTTPKLSQPPWLQGAVPLKSEHWGDRP